MAQEPPEGQWDPQGEEGAEAPWLTLMRPVADMILVVLADEQLGHAKPRSLPTDTNSSNTFPHSWHLYS